MIVVKLRPEQVKVFEAAAVKRCVARLARHLRAACPAETAAMSEDELRGEVYAGMDHARQYDIEAERDLQIFLECRLELGADFDRRADTAWAGKVLRDASLFPNEKASYLADRPLAPGGGKEPA